MLKFGFANTFGRGDGARRALAGKGLIERACVAQFLETTPYVTVGTAIAAFYVPVTIMIVLYLRIYWVTQERQREFAKLQAVSISHQSTDNNPPK
jgi:hypothetical protein